MVNITDINFQSRPGFAPALSPTQAPDSLDHLAISSPKVNVAYEKQYYFQIYNQTNFQTTMIAKISQI